MTDPPVRQFFPSTVTGEFGEHRASFDDPLHLSRRMLRDLHNLYPHELPPPRGVGSMDRWDGRPGSSLGPTNCGKLQW
jgi:hypothetical protein